MPTNVTTLGLETCCGGYTLRTGTLLILWLYAICGTFYGALQFGIGYGRVQGREEILEHCPNYTKGSDEQNWFALKPMLTTINDFKYFILAFPSYLAVYGVYKKYPTFIFPFFLLLALIMVMVLIDILVDVISYFGNKQIDTLGDILRAVLEFMIGTYFYLIIFSHYEQLQYARRLERGSDTESNTSEVQITAIPPTKSTRSTISSR